MAGVVAGADLMVEVVVLQALGGVQVKALHVQDAVDEALLVHGGDLTGDAAQGEAAVDILVDHLLAQEAGGGQGCAAGAHLHGEAVVQISGGLDDVGGGLGDQQLLGVLGIAGGPGHDALGVADVVGHDHIVHLELRDGPGGVGICHQVVGNDDHLICIFGICAGIPQRATGNAVLPIPAVSVGVAIGVTGGRTQEGHVDVQIAGPDGAGPAAVGPEYHRTVDEAPGHLLGQLAAHTGGFNVGDDAILDMADQGGVDGGQGAGSQGQVLKAHFRQLIHHGVDDMVAVAEVVVEADGHAVPKAGASDGLLQGGHQLVLPGGPGLECGGVLLAGTVIQPVVADLTDMRDFFKLDHVKSPPLRRSCSRPRTGPAGGGPG